MENRTNTAGDVMKVKALVITGFGINCEEEMAAAYRLAGAEADITHINNVFSGEVSIHGYDIINFPGGFSFGDDIASGKVLANKIRFKKLPGGGTLLDALTVFVNSGKYITGICNGFQVLTRLGLLPNLNGKCVQEASLLHNDSGRFIDNWVEVSVPVLCSLFDGLRTFDLPIRHGEGKLVFADENIRSRVKELGLNFLTYAENPNGSELDCAGLTDTTGRVIGMMPHPEAFLSRYNHPAWNKENFDNRNEGYGAGFYFFKHLVEQVIKQKGL